MHRIRRQILDLELPREQGAADLARRAARLFQQKVLPELDKVFTRIAPEGRILRINRLEIDLSRISENRFEQEFVEQCIRQIVRVVGEVAFDVTPEGAPALAQTIDVDDNLMAVFRYFLEHGILPWHAKGTRLQMLEEKMVALAKSRPEVFYPVVRSILTGNQRAQRRLILQFHSDFVAPILEVVLELPAGNIGQALQRLGELTGREITPARKIAVMMAIARMPDTVLFRQPLSAPVLATWFFEQGLAESPPKQEAVSPAPDPVKRRETPPLEPQPPANKPAAAEPDTAPSHSRSPMPREIESLPVDLCGLVLLGPYLPAFFKNLDIHIDPENPETAYKPVHLLHFLASGEENPEEPLLALPKVICGLPLDEPVPREFELTEAEKDECTQLLEAVIQNWPALKNTSPGGLRSGFLQRTGLLSWDEDRRAWLLRIERQAQDLLLERLPWSISVLKMAWMDWIVQVEW